MSPATALLSLFFELAKTDCDKERFFIHCRSYTNNDEKIGLLWQAFAANKRLLRNILACHANRTTLSSMDWRLEFDVSPRAYSTARYYSKLNIY